MLHIQAGRHLTHRQKCRNRPHRIRLLLALPLKVQSGRKLFSNQSTSGAEFREAMVGPAGSDEYEN